MKKLIYLSFMVQFTLFISCNKTKLRDRDGWLRGNTTDFFVLSITDSNLSSFLASTKTFSFSVADMLNGINNKIKKHIKL